MGLASHNPLLFSSSSLLDGLPSPSTHLRHPVRPAVHYATSPRIAFSRQSLQDLLTASPPPSLPILLSVRHGSQLTASPLREVQDEAYTQRQVLFRVRTAILRSHRSLILWPCRTKRSARQKSLRFSCVVACKRIQHGSLITTGGNAAIIGLPRPLRIQS